VASNGTPGSEFTGLYFDATNKRRAWVNIQHPDSDNDPTVEVSIPDQISSVCTTGRPWPRPARPTCRQLMVPRAPGVVQGCGLRLRRSQSARAAGWST
jgi:hypothetical protein